MQVKNPDDADLREMAGRMYEASDLRLAIERGHLKTMDDVLAWTKDTVADLQKLLESPRWVIDGSGCCVDVKASINRPAQNEGA